MPIKLTIDQIDNDSLSNYCGGYNEPLIQPPTNLAIHHPMDMRSGSNKLLAFILQHHPGIRPHCAYLFYNKTGTRLKYSSMTDWAFGYAPEHWMMADFTDLANASCDITAQPTQPQDSPSVMSNSI